MTELRISPDLALPLEFATEASAILARRGRGKTYTASVLAEELHAAGQPFVVLDPVGVWWGLRSSADGQAPGLDVKILGGEHNDLTLDEKAGTRLATFVVDNPAAYVLDLSSFESKAAQDRFVADFAERLYRYKAAQERRTPLTLIIDEADQFAPQSLRKSAQGEGNYGPKMLGALESIVRQGRARGLGCVLITQRPAVLNKNVLTQAGALVLLGITGPQDRDAVDDWIKGHAEPEERKEVIGSMARLDVGEAWVWWPTEDLLQRVQVRQRRTFDSSSTPKAGEKPEAVAFADVDLDALKDALAESVEKAKAEDPKLLQATIRDLRRELAEAKAVKSEPEVQVERVEVPVVPVETAQLFRDACDDLAKIADGIGDGIGMLSGAIDQLTSTGEGLRLDLLEATRDRQDVPRAGAAGGSAGAVANRRGTGRAAQRPDPPARREPRRAPVPGAEAAEGDTGLTRRAERVVLSVLAQYPHGRSKRQLAMLTGYVMSGGGFNNALGTLRRLAYIEGSDPIFITDAGLEAIGDTWEPLPTGQALVDHRMAQLKRRAEREALRVFMDAYPDELAKEDAAARMVNERGEPYEPSGGGFNNAVGKLRTLELVDGWRAADDFMDAVNA